MFFRILDQAGVGIAQSTFGARFHSTGRWESQICAARNPIQDPHGSRHGRQICVIVARSQKKMDVCFNSQGTIFFGTSMRFETKLMFEHLSRLILMIQKNLQ